MQSSSLVTGRLQVADSALGSVVSQVTQAISLATSANNGTNNPGDVKSPLPIRYQGFLAR